MSQIHKTTDRAVRFWCESDGERETRRGTTVGEKIERKQLLIKNGVLNVHSSHGVSHIWHPDMYEQLRCGAPPSPVTGYDVLDVPPTGPLWMFYSPVSSVMDLKYSNNNNTNLSLVSTIFSMTELLVHITLCYLLNVTQNKDTYSFSNKWWWWWLTRAWWWWDIGHLVFHRYQLGLFCSVLSEGKKCSRQLMCHR